MSLMKTFPTRALLTAILGAMSYATHASGADAQDSIAVTVRYDDLDLSAQAGVATLKRRVSTAAEQVCADGYLTDPIGKLAQLTCIRRATDKALAQVKWPEK